MKLVHLQTNINDLREIRSTESLKSLTNFKYVNRISQVYDGEVPSSEWFLPHNARDKTHLQRSYGCYLAHRQAIEQEFDEEFIVVCECDCVLLTCPKMFYKMIDRVIPIMKSRNLVAMGIGGMAMGQETDGIILCKTFSEAHCMLYTKRDYVVNLLQTNPWSAFDYWLSRSLIPQNELATTSIRWTTQAEGLSLIDNKTKIEKTGRNAIGRLMTPDDIKSIFKD